MKYNSTTSNPWSGVKVLFRPLVGFSLKLLGKGYSEPKVRWDGFYQLVLNCYTTLTAKKTFIIEMNVYVIVNGWDYVN